MSLNCSLCGGGDFTTNGLYTISGHKELFVCEFCRATKHVQMKELGLKRFVLLRKPPGY